MLKVSFCGQREPLQYELTSEKCVEDIIIEVCKKLSITPCYRHIFSLKDIKSNLWFCWNKKLSSIFKDTVCQFRVRFKPHCLTLLQNKDIEAYNYYFYQVREDFIANNIPSLAKLPDNIKLGIVVTDIVHYMLLNPDLKIGDIELSRFLPSRLNSLPIKLNLRRTTGKYLDYNKDITYIKTTYLDEVEKYGSSVGIEEYEIELLLPNNSSYVSSKLQINPSTHSQPGVYYSTDSKNWELLLNIEDLITISIRYQDYVIDICHKSPKPFSLRCQSEMILESVVGVLSGYYRLMENWTIDLCGDLVTPSLKALKKIRCHGPVGKEFASKKLMLKAEKEQGLGLLYESEKMFDCFHLLIHDNTTAIKEYLILTTQNKVHFDGCDLHFDSITELINHYTTAKEENTIGLTRLLYPSDFDRVNGLRICADIDKPIQKEVETGPRFYSHSEFDFLDKKAIRGSFYNVHPAKLKSQNLKVAIKVPDFGNSEEKGRFCEIMQKYSFLESNDIVKIHGLILQPIAIVMELFLLGSLDQYLKQNKDKITKNHLIEATKSVASALWYLNTKDIHHNNIRCQKILVESHSPKSLKVKLGDPGNICYTSKDIHWIPVEHHNQPATAILDPSTDFWAYGTTVWEIFSFGTKPLEGCDSPSKIQEIKSLYASGRTLPRPQLCPVELYQIITSLCWSKTAHTRRQPQVILGEVSKIYLQVCEQPCNPYSAIDLEEAESIAKVDENSSSYSMMDENTSVATDYTNLSVSSLSLDISFLIQNNTSNDILKEDLHSIAGSESSICERLVNPYDDQIPRGVYSMGSSDIIFNSKIGEGHYGVVYKGVCKHHNGLKEQVAIKTTKVIGVDKDFEREFNIMKKLDHPCVVKILGMLGNEQDISFKYMVMEYLPNGSLLEYISGKKQHITDKHLLQYAIDIARGMDYLEIQNIIHRDLAARNVLVTTNENHCKISDFGLAQVANEGHYYIIKTNRDFPIEWYAIEALEKGKFSSKSDVWSYGVTCWEMFTRGAKPYENMHRNDIKKNLKKDIRLLITPSIPQNVYSELIRPCWRQNPAERPNFSELQNTCKELMENFS